MLNILINAYAVSPKWGSEPGLGWNWIVNLAKYCNVFVITEGEWRKEIENAIKDLPQRHNIHFYYNPVSSEIRKMCWNQGDWRFYKYYRQWQEKTLEIAKEIIANGYNRHRLKQFQGAYGTSYIKLYQPIISYKDELSLRIHIEPKK